MKAKFAMSIRYMKRLIMLTLTGAVLVAAVSFVFVVSTASRGGHVNGEKIIAAIAAYKHELTARGVAVPDSVPLQELVSRGLLNRDDGSGFEGMEVTLSLVADESRPQEFLMRAKLADGHELAVLGDGSVQYLRK